jgi:hypothetical protein
LRNRGGRARRGEAVPKIEDLKQVHILKVMPPFFYLPSEIFEID